MIRFIYWLFRNYIDISKINYRFRLRVFKKKGDAGKPLRLLNIDNIIIGNNVRIRDGYRIECYESFYGKKLSPKLILEDRVIIGPGFTGFIASELTIGKDTILAGNVTLITENHGMNPESDIPFHAQPLTIGPVSIGEGCWLGQNVVVLPNVKIGNKCVIASSAVVSSDIPDYSVAAGCPARVIKRYCFETHQWEKA